MAERPIFPAAHSWCPPSIGPARSQRNPESQLWHATLEVTQRQIKSISHRCHQRLVAFVWELKEIIDLPLGCLQGGLRFAYDAGTERVVTAAYPSPVPLKPRFE